MRVFIFSCKKVFWLNYFYFLASKTTCHKIYVFRFQYSFLLN